MRYTPDELIAMGYQARRAGRLAQAQDIFSKAVGLCRETDDVPLLASSLSGLGQIERDLKNTRAALQHYSEAVGICRRVADPLRLAHTIRHLADILRGEGSIEQARPLYQEVLEIYRCHKEVPPLDLANAVRGFCAVEGDLW